MAPFSKSVFTSISEGKGITTLKCAVARKQAKNRIKARVLNRHRRRAIAERLLKTASSLPHCLTESSAQQVQRFECLPSPITPKPTCYFQPLRYHATYTPHAARTPRVRFHESVVVTEIPSHRSCDEELRKVLWSGQKESRVNMTRNRREFASDGGDWRNCKEEDEMLTFRGKLVHPATYLLIQRNQQKRVVQRLRVAKNIEQMLPLVNHA